MNKAMPSEGLSDGILRYFAKVGMVVERFLFFNRLYFNIVLIGVLGFNVFNRIGFFLTEKIIVFSLVNN